MVDVEFQFTVPPLSTLLHSKNIKKNIHRGEGEKIGKIARKEISFMSCEIKFYLATDGIEGEKKIE